jgi:ATP-dependent Clp protease ATP-binding subunit ClpC
MFERYTESARQAIFWALHVAHESGSAFIETDHLLAGLLGADAALAQQYPGLAEFAPKSAAHAAPPPILEPVPRRELPLSSEAKRALDYAAEESQRVADRHIGTEHLLLGMLREEGSRAAEAIRGAGFELSQLRAGLLRRQAEASGAVPGVLARTPSRPAARSSSAALKPASSARSPSKANIFCSASCASTAT